MTTAGRSLFLGWLETLHKECVAGSGSLTLTPNVAPVGSTMQLDVQVKNQNDRQLFGRKVNPGYDSRMLERLDSVTFLAYEPRDLTALMSLNISSNLSLRATFQIPLVPVQTTLTARDTLWWVTIGGSNGGLGSPAPGPEPTGGSCGEIRRVPGEGSSYLDYEAHCATFYHVDYVVPPSLPSGLQIQRGRAIWTFLNGDQGESDDSGCGADPCLSSVRVELIDVFGNIVGRTVKPI